MIGERLKAKPQGKTLRSPGFKLFLATVPFLAIFFIFSYFPLTGWRYAFYNYKPGYDLADCEYVGFQHITSMFTDSYLRKQTFRVLRNTFVMSGLSIAGSFLPMFFAIALSELPGKRYRKLVQTATTIPNFISWVLVFAFANALLATEGGLVNILLRKTGLREDGINFLATTGLPNWLVMWGISLWKSLGWASIIYLSAITSIDQELFEAAACDGATRFQRIRYITIPCLLPTFITLMILNIGNFLSTGMEQYMLFQNPFNKDTIEVLDLFVYNQGIGEKAISYSTAVSMLKSLVGIVLVFTANQISGKVRENKIF